MKMYIQDCGWRGSILVIANNEAEARDMMKNEYNYEPDGIVEEEEIKHGFIFSNLGDC